MNVAGCFIPVFLLSSLTEEIIASDGVSFVPQRSKKSVDFLRTYSVFSTLLFRGSKRKFACN